METYGDCPSAIRHFDRAAAGPDRDTAARALFHSALCKQRLSIESFRDDVSRLLREFPATDAAQEARLRFGRASTLAARIRLGQSRIRVDATIPLTFRPDLVAGAPNGNEIYISTGPSVAVFDLRRKVTVHRIELGKQVKALRMSPDGGRVAVASFDETLDCIVTSNKAIEHVDTRGELATSAAFTADSKRLLLTIPRRGIQELELGTSVSRMIDTRAGAASIAMSADGNTFAVAYDSPNTSLVLFDTQTGAQLHRLLRPEFKPHPITFTPDGAQAWSVATGACRATKSEGCPDLTDQIVHVIRVRDGRYLKSFGFGGPSGTLAPFPDSSLMAFGNMSALSLMDTHNLEVLETLPIPSSGSIVFLADGHSAVTPLPDKNALAILRWD